MNLRLWCASGDNTKTAAVSMSQCDHNREHFLLFSSYVIRDQEDQWSAVGIFLLFLIDFYHFEPIYRA